MRGILPLAFAVFSLVLSNLALASFGHHGADCEGDLRDAESFLMCCGTIQGQCGTSGLANGTYRDTVPGNETVISWTAPKGLLLSSLAVGADPPPPRS